MSSTVAVPGDMPDEPSQAADLVGEAEAFLAGQVPTPPAVAATPVTARVQRLAAQVAEAHAIAALQRDPTPLLVDTERVRRRRLRAVEAAALHQLGQDPATRAWEAARWRRAVTAVAVVALGLALAWSTAGVQIFAAQGAPAWSPSWLFAWCVEPFMSLALLVVIGARAFLATRGAPLEDPALKRVERLLLALTLGMNAWPHLPGVARPFGLSALVLHVLGPVVAVSVVSILPIIWAGFANLDHGQADQPDPGGLYPGPTGPQYRANTTRGSAAPATGTPTPVLIDRARALIATGRLPADPSASRLRTALGCGTDAARRVRDALAPPTTAD